MKRLSALILLVALLAALLAACGGAPKSSSAGQPAAGKAQDKAPAANQAKPAVKATAAKAADAANADAESADVASVDNASDDNASVDDASAGAAPTDSPASNSSDSLTLDNRATGLDKLKSYRMRWQAQWSGTESGKTEAASWDWVEEWSSEPKGLHWSWKFSNPNQKDEGVMEAWQIADTMYMKTGEADGKSNCMSISSEDQKDQLEKGVFNPDSLGSVRDARYVGTETVNGIQAKHYKYSDQSASLAGLGKVSGEMWVAVDGGYVVKDTMAWQGSAGLFGAGAGKDAQGEGKWTWELSDVDKPIEIKAPENCGGAAKGLPMMKDASEKSSFGDMTTYKTAGSFADVVEFYKQQMPAAGWKAEGDPSVMDEFANLEFSKDKQKATVTITKDDEKTSVMINVQQSE